MRIIDSYCGAGPWARRDPLLPATPDQTIAVLDQCGIEKAIVHSNLARTRTAASDANQCILEIATGNDRFLPAFVLTTSPYEGTPSAEIYASDMSANGVRTVWLLPAFGKPNGIWPWLISDLMNFCSDAKLPVFLPFEGLRPNDIHGLCKEFPRLRLVLTGLSYGDDPWLYPLLRLFPELRLCLSPRYIPPLGIERFVRHFGAERMIFGSGLPFFAPGGLIGYVAYARIKLDQKQQIFADNIERLMQEVQL